MPKFWGLIAVEWYPILQVTFLEFVEAILLCAKEMPDNQEKNISCQEPHYDVEKDILETFTYAIPKPQNHSEAEEEVQVIEIINYTCTNKWRVHKHKSLFNLFSVIAKN